MKIDRNKLKKSTTEVPADCRVLIEKLKTVPDELLQDELRTVKAWVYGKCELYHWSDILDRFDDVLEKACKKEPDKKWMLACDESSQDKLKELLQAVLHFTALLIEHSFSRHLYNSMEHLTTLLSSSDMTVVLAVLNLLYVFSKRSNFITRLSSDKKQGLIIRLTHLAESWGGKDNGFGLADCCKDDQATNFPPSATTLHFEFYMDNKEEKGSKKNTANVITSIHMDNLDKSSKIPSEIMEELLVSFKVPDDKQMLLYTHIRLANLFSKHDARIQCVHARLQALAILVYSNAIQENMNTLLYPGLIEEMVDIIELKDESLVEIKAASLRTLTSIIHLERNPKLDNIIDATGASSYHGFLPVLVRTCIQHMTDPLLKPFPQQYATALFSFLYHLASYENGVEALVSCGMMECLLKVINWYGDGQDHITQFVTRAVRVVDLITNLDMAAFQTQGGLNTFLNRLEHEVDICRKENPFEIRIHRDSMSESQESPQGVMETEISNPDSPREPEDPPEVVNEGASTSAKPASEGPTTVQAPSKKSGVQCFPQRAALLKSMLNFLKKAIPDPSFSESIRHLMEQSLPKSLRHIISNAEYYGPSLFLLATDVVTVYVFQEPSLLSSLQDNGLTDVVLHALLIKDVPATREVLASLPNVFSALCLNTRGLESFVSCKPFDRLFKVLLSPDYLPAMRRRRSSDPFGKLGDTASNLGNAMDELMRHQPSLRTDATKAIIKLLEEVCAMGMDPKFVCQKPQPKIDSNVASVRSPLPTDNGSSDEEDEEEELATESTPAIVKPSQEPEPALSSQTSEEKQAIPLIDYVLNVMKFVEAILSNNSTDDHCREFVTQKGLQPLMGILGLPNLPIDFPASPACQAVSIVCKSILTLSREPQVLKQGLLKLDEVLQSLESLHQPLEAPGGSVLLRELANVAHLPEAVQSPQSTPLLHALSSCHAYILMFVHVCRMGQTDIRTISVNHWGSELGLKVLEGLSKLYTSLVWESTVLLALCSEDVLPSGCEFGKADMDKLLPKDFKPEKDSKDDEPGSLSRHSGEMGSNGVSAAMESLSTSENTETPMEVGENQQTSDKDGKKPKMSPQLQAQVKQLKPLLSVSSRLCRTLAELFGLLVKLCVGSPVRQRRSHQIPPPPTTPSPAAQAVAKALTKLLTNGLQWTPPEYSPVPKLRLTFLVCSVGFTSPMLFDEKKQPYHLMLQKFLSSGGQNALFEAFSWALSMDGKVPMSEGLENPELPDGTGEFIDAWLMLVEKMVNPKTVLESTHTLPSKSSQSGFVPFSAVQYLISTQKAAFNAVMHLWNKKPLKVYGGRMSESILAILCHIIKGENTIKEYLKKEREEATNSNTAAASNSLMLGAAVASIPTPPQRPAQTEVNQEHLQQLVDMGFTREHGVQALTHTSGLEQATEYILTHPLAAMPPTTSNETNSGTIGMGFDLSEEDQMMRAIAMSLGENVLMSTDQDDKSGPSSQSDGQGKSEKSEEVDEKQENEEPLDSTVLDQFTDTVLPGSLTLLDTLPETVYRVCDLLIVVTARNGSSWQKQVLSALVQEVQNLGQQLLSIGHTSTSDKETQNDKKAHHPDSSKFATRLHLFSLLFEETRMPCAETMDNVYLTDLLVQVLSSGQEFLSVNKDYVTPKWLAPLLLLLDLYEKVSVISKRKAEADKLLAASHTWKWFDDGSGRWCKYSVGNNKTIDDAYQSGENSIRFQAGRRRYTVYFSSMVQVNEETGNRRPIMLTLPSSDEKVQANVEDKKTETTSSPATESSMETETETTLERQPSRETKIVNGLNADQVTSIIRSVVSLINIPVESESLHAALRLVLRLTREHNYAILFAELGGPKVLLSLTQASAFQGFVSLTTLIFRHILEEPMSLKYCMEKAIRKATSGSGSSVSGVQMGSLGSKELHYVLRLLGPAACRNPQLFTEVAKNTLRIALPPPSKRDEDESRFTGPNAAQILKGVSTKQVISNTVDSPIKDVVYDLLNCLIVKCKTETSASATATGVELKADQLLSDTIAEVNREIQNRQSSMVRQNSAADLPLEEDNSSQTDVPSEISTSKDNKDNKDQKSAEELRKQNLLMPKSSILRLLSEIVKSYSSCTHLITQHIYQSGQSDLLPEECSVLAFVLDNLLPQCQVFGDRDCPALSRVFIASIASCNNRPDAQLSLVTEIKNALQRALGLPESSEKHVRIQSLTHLISIIIESCPSPGQVPNQVFKGQQTLMNNIVKSLLKKGLVADLARIPHSLDLASPYMANTMNAALKPLETLSRSVNQPLQSVTAKAKGKGETSSLAQGGGITAELNSTVAENSTTVVTREGEVTIEDITDQADQHDDLEETEPLEAVEPDMHGGAGLDGVIDTLLGRDTGLDPERQVLGDIVMETEDISQASEHDQVDDNDDELIDVEEMDHHDSRMVSQEISIDDDEGDENTHVDVHDDDSADSGSDADDDDNDDGNDDDQDDDDDDDDDEEDDDEGSDMEAEDEDDYNDQEIDAPIGHHFHDDNVFNMDDMMYPLAPSVPPAPSNVMPSHPLLIRQPDTGVVNARLHRGGRQRSTYRYNPSTQTLHVNFPRQQPNPPVILQRLLGPTTAADVLQLTSTLTSVAGPAPSRLVLANDDLRIISRQHEEDFEDLFPESYSDNNAAGTGVLTYIPSTLTRWTEEAKVLDGDSVNDCMTVLKPEIMEVLEKHRDDELAERREKRKKTAEEELAKKQEQKDQPSKTFDWRSPQQMEYSIDGVTPISSSQSTTTVTTAATTTTTVSSLQTPAASSQDNNGRQISASEAAAAAELIATAMVEGILSTPATTTTTSVATSSAVVPSTTSASSMRPTSRSVFENQSSATAMVEGILSTPATTTTEMFITPSQPIPILTPAAPIRPARTAFENNRNMNLASLLMNEMDATPDSSRNSAGLPTYDNPASVATIAGQPISGSQPPTEGSITPEEVSGISSSDAVTVQSSESSEELSSGNIGAEAPVTTSSGQGAIDTGGIRSFLQAADSSFSNVLETASLASESLGPSDLTPAAPADTAFNFLSLDDGMLGAFDPGSVPLPPMSTETSFGTPPLSQALVTSAPTTVTSTVSSTSVPSTSTISVAGSSVQAASSGGSVPDGVDPSFLAALPENIRQEVIAEQLRLQRIQESARQQAQSAQNTGSMEVNPDFLAALPPSIQEEVLAQQRAEQARLQSQNTPTSAPPDTPVDPAGFLATLPTSLRQQVLADMDDSMVAVLPADLAAEAQSLRSEFEERHRRLMQERLFAQAGAGSLSAILRHTGFAGRLGAGRYAIRAAPRGSNQWAWGCRVGANQAGSSNANAVKLRGRHLLDHEALTCLLVLLFVDEPKLNTSRLHRVLRNLCYHGPTRIWVIRALLSILQKTGDSRMEETKCSGDKGKRKSSSDTTSVSLKTDTKSQGSWLSISLEAALGCRANVFQIQKTGKKHTPGGPFPGSVTVHPQAAPVVCRHVMDTLIALAKVFPSQFLPATKAKEVSKCEETDKEEKKEEEDTQKIDNASPKPSATTSGEKSIETDFWDHLIKLDSAGSNKKGKNVQRTHSTPNMEGEANFYNFESSPLGQLMLMLSHPVIKRSQLLTDRLLRLLGLVSIGLPDVTQGTPIITPVTVQTSNLPGNAATTSIATDSTPSTVTTATVTTPVSEETTPTSDGTSAQTETKIEKSSDSKQDSKEPSAILESQLQLAVQVLTSKSCSEEGLEDATNLLLQLSWANNATRSAVLKLLLEGGRELGITVCSHIRSLLEELRHSSNRCKDDVDEDMKDADTGHSAKGFLYDRYSGSNIVVAAPKKLKGGRELQLPSMSLLTSKTSSQQFFLRILKVIIQLRDAARTVVKKNSRRPADSHDLSNIAEAMAALEAEAEAIMEMVGRRAQQNHLIREAVADQSTTNNAPATPSSTGATGEDSQVGDMGLSDNQSIANQSDPAPSDSTRDDYTDTPMDIDQSGSSDKKKEEDSLPRLSEQLLLEELWQSLGECLTELARTPDHHAVLILQPAVEAFFIVHAGEKDGKNADQSSQKREDQLAHLNLDIAPASPAASTSDTPASLARENSVASVHSIATLPPDTQKFLKFAETHRTVLNQILRQSTTPLADGPFSVLVDHTRILDFDVKRRYFRQELERLDEGLRREDLAVHVRREHVFEDSFRELFRRTADEWKHRFYIVFEGEEGQDAGGLLREWYIIISREIFNPMYALFCTSPGDRVTYQINPSSHCNSNHLSYYKFVGRIIAKAIYDNKLLECYFTRSFYKHIIGQAVKYTDMESEDYAFYQGLVFLLENDVRDLGYDLAFSTEVQEFGVTEARDLKPNGSNLPVTEANKKEYVKLVCQMKMTSAIRKQLNAFMEGFYDIIPKRLISIFNEQELELLISGLPTIDIDDLKSNSEYHKYQANSLQVQWFWRALRSFDQSERAQFLQFVTGTSKVPLQGFAFLEGMNGYQKFQIHRDDRSTDRLPVAHTCFNQLDLPAYETYDKLRKMLLLAINECSEGFGLA